MNKHITLGYDNQSRRIIKYKTKNGKIIYKAELPDGRFVVVKDFKG